MSKDKTQNLEYAAGPLNKSEETKLMEQIISALISDMYQNSVKEYNRKDWGVLASHVTERIEGAEPNYEPKIVLLANEENNQLFASLEYYRGKKLMLQT